MINLLYSTVKVKTGTVKTDGTMKSEKYYDILQ